MKFGNRSGSAAPRLLSLRTSLESKGVYCEPCDSVGGLSPPCCLSDSLKPLNATGGWTRWPLKSLPTHTILWFYDSMILWFYDSVILWLYEPDYSLGPLKAIWVTGVPYLVDLDPNLSYFIFSIHLKQKWIAFYNWLSLQKSMRYASNRQKSRKNAGNLGRDSISSNICY